MYFAVCSEYIRFITSKQFISALITTLLVTAAFSYVSWSSPTIPLLTSPNSPIGVQLTGEEASWVVSALALGIMPGSLTVLFLIDKIGRKKTMLISSFLIFVPWLIKIFTKSIAMLLVARVVAGFGTGVSIGVVPLYIGEIAEKNHRGTLCSMSTLGMVLATILVYTIGPFVSYTTLTSICASLPVIFVIASYFIPESPSYLIKCNQRQAAEDVLTYLSETESVAERLKEIEATIQNEETSNLKLSELFFQRNYRKSFLIVIVLKTLQQFSGSFVINAYIQTIMEDSQTSLSAETSSVIFAAIQIPCVLISSFLVDKLGRRPLLIISSLGCVLSLAGEGVYFYLAKRQHIDLSGAYFVPTLCLTLYFIMSSFGISTLPYVAAGELFTPKVKKVSGTLFGFYSGLLSFVSNKVFNPIVEHWGMHVAFWIFASVCVLGALFGFLVLPETKGKTFEEIQEILYEKLKTDKRNNSIKVIN